MRGRRIALTVAAFFWITPLALAEAGGVASSRVDAPFLIAPGLLALGVNGGPPNIARPAAGAGATPATSKSGVDWSSVRLAQIARADAYLRTGAESVMDKPEIADSGDKHDYLSYAPYWWPDPEKSTGRPYVRRDGLRNSDLVKAGDSGALNRMSNAVETLSLAYGLSGDERYAEKAAALLNTWFIDAATRMNPNFQHAQAIPGVTSGRGIGLIEARAFIRINESLPRLARSSVWTSDRRAAMRAWMEAFYAWLTTSPNAREEAEEVNNHGTWFDAQTAHLALSLGHVAVAKDILNKGLEKRIAAQIEPDGSQPHELARTRALSYAIFNLEAMMLCAQLGRAVNVDWWSYRSKDGRSMEGALAWLAPYADPAKTWPQQDVVEADRARIVLLLEKFLRYREQPQIRAAYEAFRTTVSAERYATLFH